MGAGSGYVGPGSGQNSAAAGPNNAFAGPSPTPTPGAPTSPSATDLRLVAMRRARSFSLFSLGRGYNADFQSSTSLGTKPTTGPVTYGSSQQTQLGGQTQFGDDTGTTGAPNLNGPGAPPINPANPNGPPAGTPPKPGGGS